MLRAGLKPGPAYMLSVEGRRSGEMRSTPVTPLEYGGRRYLVAGGGGADWVKNARASGWAILGRERRSEKVRLVELDPQEAVPVLKRLV